MIFTIRELRAADLDEVVAIAASSPESPQWANSAYGSYITPDPTHAALVRGGLAAVVSDGPGTSAVGGFACFTLVRDGRENLAQLDSIAVRPGLRRHGMGAALLRGSLAWAAAHGAMRFSLEVRASNGAAIAFYQRFGLRPEGRRPRYYAEPEEDALLLGILVTGEEHPGFFHYESG